MLLISLYDADERANLAKPEDITWFIGIELGVPIGTDRFKALETLFNTVNQDSRAHLADLAKMLAGAERTHQYILDRLILSGHSSSSRLPTKRSQPMSRAVGKPPACSYHLRQSMPVVYVIEPEEETHSHQVHRKYHQGRSHRALPHLAA